MSTQTYLWRGLLAGAVMAGAAGAVSAENKAWGPVGTWQKFDNPGPVIGADGKLHQARCSGFPGTDPRFSFWAKRGKSKNVMVFFEGGGACWDNLTCTFPIADGLPPGLPQFFVPAIHPATNPALMQGVFDASNAANPVKDWSAVYIPYCTGDLHAGSATQSYFNVGNPVLPLPPSFNIEHRGFDNFMVVLDWMRKHIEEPKSLLVTGISAGGYGASLNFPWLARAYPEARLRVLADASQGVTTQAFDQGTPGRGSWNIQFAPGAFGPNPSALSGPEILRAAVTRFPRARVSQFTTAFDQVQIGFYGVMKAFYPPGGACPNPAIDWYQQMSSKIVSYASTLPNYRYYVAAGGYHTIMSSPGFYTETSAGPSFSSWLASMLAKNGGDDDDDHVPSAWTNSACPTCLINLPCQ